MTPAEDGTASALRAPGSPAEKPSDAQLAPCPFCGCAEISIHENDWCSPEETVFFCDGCHVSKSGPTKAEATAAWNRRAPNDELTDAHGALCDANEQILDLLAALGPTVGWLKYAYGHVSSVTSEKVKAHLPKIEALIAKAKGA